MITTIAWIPCASHVMWMSIRWGTQWKKNVNFNRTVTPVSLRPTPLHVFKNAPGLIASTHSIITCPLRSFLLTDKNMVHDEPVTKEKESVCRCRDGFHCSSQACITCVAHSHCAAGTRVRDRGIMTSVKTEGETLGWFGLWCALVCCDLFGFGGDFVAGNHLHDTECQDCPPNTFSTEETGDSDCRNWTV